LTYEAAYEAYGNQTAQFGSTEDKQRANTKDQDPSGLLNEGFRYRDLETGTFITRDPLGFVDGPNMYAYVVQNPWTKFDPKGLQAQILLQPPTPMLVPRPIVETIIKTGEPTIRGGINDGAPIGGGMPLPPSVPVNVPTQTPQTKSENSPGAKSAQDTKNETDRILYRRMKEEKIDGKPTGKPEKGDGSNKRSLGVRPGPISDTNPNPDLFPDINGNVRPDKGGMSVNTDPNKVGGNIKDPIWQIKESELPTGTKYVPDKNDHGTIQPSTEMPFQEFQKKLNDSQPNWQKPPTPTPLPPGTILA
jgi:RHS repeat-associated protein